MECAECSAIIAQFTLIFVTVSHRHASFSATRFLFTSAAGNVNDARNAPRRSVTADVDDVIVNVPRTSAAGYFDDVITHINFFFS